ncbi:MAG: PPC domain-containing protein [Thermoplasmatales archaeon]|nr:PPC domain-containing protein [Thermoplasmatales archaeon]
MGKTLVILAVLVILSSLIPTAFGEKSTTSLGEAVDNTVLSWTTGGDADWFGQTSTYYYGGDAAQSGDITNSEYTYIQTTVTGPGTLTFYWKVSSESGYDYLKFYLDGSEQTKISGSTSWAQKIYSISSGSHTIQWKYTKDGSGDSGSDCGWLDKVEYTQTTPQNDADSGGDAGDSYYYATSITPGSYTGYLDSGDVYDYYKFYVSTGQKISVSMTPPSTADFDLTLYTPSYSSADSSSMGTGSTETVSYTASSSGYWQIKVSRDSGSGTYSFTVSVGEATYFEVVLLSENMVYKIGDTVPITIHLLSNGEHVNPDSTPNLWLNKDETNERTLSVSKTGTGIYTSTFTVTSTDVSTGYGYDYIDIEGEATYNGSTETSSRGVYIKGLSVTVSVSDSTPSPGDTVSITVTVKDGTTKVDASTLYLNITESGESTPQTITYTKESTGVYTAEYHVGSLTTGTYFIITATATHSGQKGLGYAYLSVSFYDIWYHKISVTSTSASFELCVSDMNGKAVSDAYIDFTYEDGWTTKSKQGTTNSNGKAGFTITYSDVDYSVYIYDGAVSKDGKTQDFSGSIDVTEGEPDTYGGFDVVSSIDTLTMGALEELGTPGSTMSVEYTAYDDGEKLTNQVIYYTVCTYSKLVASGQKTTNSDGKFTLQFTIPMDAKGTMMVNFVTKIGYSYGEDSGSLPVFGGVTISVDTLKLGGKTRVTAVPADTSCEMCMFMYVPLENESISSWSRWTSGVSSGFMILSKSDGAFTGEILLPEFMPDTDYLIMVADLSMGYGGVGSMNYVILSPGESTYSEEAGFFGGIGGIMWIVIILVIVIAFLGTGIYFVRKKPLGKVPKIPYDGVAMQQPPQQPALVQMTYTCPHCSGSFMMPRPVQPTVVRCPFCSRDVTVG